MTSKSYIARTFKRAIREMLDSGELDKKYKHKKRVSIIKNYIEKLNEEIPGGIEGMPVIPLISMINDTEIWQNIFVYMMIVEQRQQAESEATDD